LHFIRDAAGFAHGELQIAD